MANIHCNYYSDALKLNTDINVVIPTPNSDELMNNKDTSYWHPGAKYQVLYLLHGTYGDYSDWCHLTSIEKYAQNHKIMVVMPSVANSFYQDMVIGPKYLTFLTEELPQYIQMPSPRADGGRTTSSPASRWAATARGMSPSPSRSSMPRRPACPAPSASPTAWRRI